MKLDLYTKLILTVIAGCLLWICIRDANFSSSAHAQNIQQVEIVGWRLPAPFPVQINSVAAMPVRGFGDFGKPLPVEQARLPLPVIQITPTPTPSPAPR